ncbi:hypothetical protein LRAMOSA03616 [Lichtheimia ramosa]|uniref:Uncharacterized protein n=1 Tax=Lichtheimia ramosa TaxID=688394 RepID=A0A077WWF9_9FUNG|nr:hypothetical protein LRAMOSA03616 [Lichtheimia ramosa]
MLGRTSPVLSYFCVYNPSLAQNEENTKDQILYYTAKTVVPADVKMKQVGLAQALVNFSSAFSPSQPAQNVHAQKHRLIFLQPEPGFWMHMCVELGILRKQVKDSKGKEKLVTEYLDAQLNDHALEAVLRIGYEQFRLLNGTMTSILTNAARRSTLMHRIEEFFSEWIWKWDFDRLDTIVFTGVFNGVPVQPLQRQNYLRIQDLDKIIQTKTRFISHMMTWDNHGGLVYRSPGLDMQDVVALRKWICQGQQQRDKENQQQQQLVSSKSLTTHNAANTFKSFTRSLSHYFSSSAPTSPEERPSTPENDSPSSDASGTVEDVVRVHLKSRSGQEQQEAENEEELEEYFLLVYKSDLLWCFLLPAFAEGAEEWLADPASMVQLENALVEGDIYDLTTIIVENKESTHEKSSMALGKHYRCFYYDNATLNIKSTLMDQRKDAFTVNNDMLLQLLDIKNDFEAIPNTSEVYTRSTTNYWIAGRRVYNRLAIRQQQMQASTTDDHQEPPTEDEEEEDHYDEGVMSDYVEMYLVAAKKDTSLADVEETMRKMAASVVDTMRIE